MSGRHDLVTDAQLSVRIAKSCAQRSDESLQKRVSIVDTRLEIRFFYVQNLTIRQADCTRIPQLVLDQAHLAKGLMIPDMHIGVAVVVREEKADFTGQQQTDRCRFVAGTENRLSLPIVLRDHGFTTL